MVDVTASFVEGATGHPFTLICEEKAKKNQAQACPLRPTWVLACVASCDRVAKT